MTNSTARFQFSLLSILVLTTASAAILALLRPLELPPVVYSGFAVYAILLTGYFVFRGFTLLRRSRQLQRNVRDTRQELSDWVEQRRKRHRESMTTDGQSPTSMNEDDGV